jgi:hypothetical protein
MFDKLITNINIYNTKPHHEVYLMPLQQEFWKYIVGLQISNWGLPKFHIFMKSTDWQSSKFKGTVKSRKENLLHPGFSHKK